MNGELLAAETPDDSRVLVHLLQRQGVLRRKVAGELEAKLENNESIFGELLKYGGKALDTALYHRFENNLANYLGSLSRPEWTEMRGVFVDNIQMGHVTQDLVDRACILWDEATRLDVDTTIASGSVPFENDQQLWIAKAVGRGERTVSAVLLDLPMEELHARTAILEMLAKGMLAIPGEELDQDAPTDTSIPDDVVLDDDDEEEEEPVEDQETVYGIDVEEVKAALAEAEAAVDVGPDQADGADQADTILDAPLADEPDAEEPILDAPEFEEPVVDEEPGPAPEDETPTAEPVADQVDPMDQAAQAFGPTGSYMPNSLDEWKEQASVVDDDELDFFQDHDHDRGTQQDGSFSTESHNLDRVEVMDLSEPEPEPEVLEADEAPAARFGAPVLSEDEALEKLDVANEVLANVVRAFDAAEGAGRGRSLLQLLVDGSPSKFAVLLNDLHIAETGVLPDDQVMANLYSRPPTEHRQLLNSALVDVIERAISQAADELPDEQFDDMYEAVAGYRQRLGL